MHFLVSANTTDFKIIIFSTTQFYILYSLLPLWIGTRIDVTCSIFRLKSIKTKAGIFGFRWISHIWAELWTDIDGILSNIFPSQHENMIRRKSAARYLARLYLLSIHLSNKYLLIYCFQPRCLFTHLINEFTHSFHKDIVSYGLDTLS